MKPNIILKFDDSSITFSHATPLGWKALESVAFDAENFDIQITQMRSKLLGLTKTGLNALTLLPHSQILFTSFEISETEKNLEDLTPLIAEFLTGQTPYEVNDLTWHMERHHNTIQLAVIANETLREAEAFSERYQFNAIYHASLPVDGENTATPFSTTLLFGSSQKSLQTTGVSNDIDIDPKITIIKSTPPVVTPKTPPRISAKPSQKSPPKIAPTAKVLAHQLTISKPNSASSSPLTTTEFRHSESIAPETLPPEELLKSLNPIQHSRPPKKSKAKSVKFTKVKKASFTPIGTTAFKWTGFNKKKLRIAALLLLFFGGGTLLWNTIRTPIQDPSESFVTAPSLPFTSERALSNSLDDLYFTGIDTDIVSQDASGIIGDRQYLQANTNILTGVYTDKTPIYLEDIASPPPIVPNPVEPNIPESIQDSIETAIDPDQPTQPQQAETNTQLSNEILAAPQNEDAQNLDPTFDQTTPSLDVSQNPLAQFRPLARPDLQFENSSRLELAAFAPTPRPVNSLDQIERSQFNGRTRSELAAFQPSPRPTPPSSSASPTLASDTAVSIDQIIAETSSEIAPNNPNDSVDMASLIPTARPNALAERAARVNTPQTQTSSTSAAVTLRSAPVSVARAATQNDAINLRALNLIGVYGKPSNPSALIRLKSGRYETVKIGETLDGGKITSIQNDKLTYIKNGKAVTLEIGS